MVTKTEMEALPKIVAVDFDGCLVKDRFPEIGDPNWDLVKTLRTLKDKGIRLILWTSRNGTMLDDAVEFCKNELHMEFDSVNQNLPECIAMFGGDTRKVYADLYIDDKAIPHTQHPLYWLDRIGL